MPYATGTVVGYFTGIDGKPSSGSAHIVPSTSVLLDDTDDVVLSGSVSVKLTNGQFELVLPATDDPTLNPTDFGYAATVTLAGGRKFGPVSFALPGGDTVDLVDLLPADEGSFDPTVTYVSATDLAAEAELREDGDDAEAAARTTAIGIETTARLAAAVLLADAGPDPIKVASQRTIISTFQSGHGWTSGGTGISATLNDTSNPGLGSQSATFTTGVGQIGYVESPTISPAINLTGKTFAVLVRIPAAVLDNMSYAYVYAGSGGSFANYNNFRIRLRSQQQNNQSASTTGDEWVWLTCPRSQMAVGAGTVDLTAINKIRVVAGPLAGVQTTLSVAAVATIDLPTTKFPNGAVSLTFDDGYASLATMAKTYMDKYGMRGTVFPIREVIDGAGKVTTAQLQAMARNGWEVALHTDTLSAHAAGFIGSSDTTIRTELGNDQRGLAALGLGRRTGFAWPRGQLDGTSVQSVRRHASYGRLNDFASGAETLPPADAYRIRSWPIAATDTLGTLTALVDAAKTGLAWQVFTIHDIVSSGATGGQQMNQSTFNSLIDYLATAGVPVLSISDVAGLL